MALQRIAVVFRYDRELGERGLEKKYDIKSRIDGAHVCWIADEGGFLGISDAWHGRRSIAG